MWTKPYGKTGKNISAVGMGGMRFGNAEDLDASAAIVKHAFDKGINYFDTSPGYHGGTSEDIFGLAFKEMPRERYYVSTKSNKPDGDEFRKDLETSLKKMGVEKIDFHHIWWVLSKEAWEGRVAGGAIDAALKAKEEGLIDHVCCSAHMSGEDLSWLIDNASFLEGLTLGYCAINFPYRQAGINKAHDRGLGVVTMNPLGGGFIPQNPEAFEFLKSEDDKTVVEAALRFNVSQPAVTCALVGVSTIDHVDQAVAAVENFNPYPQEHIEEIKSHILKSFDGLCTGCQYCLPCPAGVAIPHFMETYNLLSLKGPEARKEMYFRMKWHWGTDPENSKACTECGLCERRCTQHLPIRERLKYFHDMTAEEFA